MAITRRNLIKASACALWWQSLRAKSAPQQPAFVSGIRDPKIAARSPGEGFGAAAFTAAGTLLWQSPLPARSHGQALHPLGDLLIVFARRPGDYAAVIAARTGKVIRLIAPAKGRVFQGHGCFSRDGKTLFTSENAFEEGRGVIGVYDTATFTRRGEWASGGVGCHEILMVGPKRLAIANGGILTHPGMPRKKLNLSTMRSDITLLDTGTGTIVARHSLPASAVAEQLSLRHLALHPSGRTLAVAAQHQQNNAAVPLLYSLELSSGAKGALRPMALPAQTLSRMKGYCGSVAFSPCGQWLFGSSPKGGMIAALPLAAAGASQIFELRDGCGIASQGNCGTGQTVFTSGSGAILSLTMTQHPIKKEDHGRDIAHHSLPLQFDNHAALLG